MPDQTISVVQTSVPSYTDGPITLRWSESLTFCELTDSDRQFGHIVQVNHSWVVYDAVHSNPANNAFRVLGMYGTLAEAKEMLEENVRIFRTPKPRKITSYESVSVEV